MDIAIHICGQDPAENQIAGIQTPTAFNHPAQGWRDEGAPTLGTKKTSPTLKGLNRTRGGAETDSTLSGLGALLLDQPRVARSSQPWARGLNAVGVFPVMIAIELNTEEKTF